MTVEAIDDRLTRRVTLRCVMPGCNAELLCPDPDDPWTWLQSEEARAFKAKHVAHGSEKTVGPVIEHVEKQP
ncbi:MAG: hypothetical protein AB7F39_06605 [Variibacter sp.]